MSLDLLTNLIHEGSTRPWQEVNTEWYAGLFGAPSGRYPKTAENQVQLRSPQMADDKGISYAAIIHRENPTKGRYRGTSLVIFPSSPTGPCLLGLVVGTDGLSPDEAILGRPGHARKAQAIARWLNKRYGGGQRVAWAKQDPTRTDESVPSDLLKEWEDHKPALDRYGKELYLLFRPTEDRSATRDAAAAMLDLLFEERGYEPLAALSPHASELKAAWFEHLMPSVDSAAVTELLQHRRFVILQGPPGTGKTRLAVNLLRDRYQGHGISIQFHPNTTYESFLGGLSPQHAADALGLRFAPEPGSLMRAAAAALADPSRPYLLHIDEINRADLGKVLGEGLFLLEAHADSPRIINLPYDFGPPFHRQLTLPPNLHLLGTMNSADRSIALVDAAVRRRFAFVSLWPSMAVVEANACPLMQIAFRRLTQLFIEYASDDTLPLVPGHSYFLEADPAKAPTVLRTNLAPLLEEYLAQGYVSGFAEAIRSYLQWLNATA
ncbi:MAG: AAA family ATPase [Acidobacteria bacterium]|nr:AAA family ATPase [Acidobacteriota bacterium]